MDLTGLAKWRHRGWIQIELILTGGMIKLGSNQRNQTNGGISGMVRKDEWEMPCLLGTYFPQTLKTQFEARRTDEYLSN